MLLNCLSKFGVLDLSDPAQIIIHPNQTNAVDAGNTITFVCVAYGNPIPFMSWNRGDTVLSNDSHITISEGILTNSGAMYVQSILELCSAEGEDTGQYNCFANNTLGNDNASFVLTTQSKHQYNY